MVAEAIVRDASELRCNCRMSVRRQGSDDALVVKARSWDCPSCGLDKRRALRLMVATEGSRWLLTLTYRQPAAYDRAGTPVVPPEHQGCDRHSHTYRYVDQAGRASWRWRTLASCAHCCGRRSIMLRHLVKRLRRLWGNGFRYLGVVEDQKNGAMHLHLALSGVPEALPRLVRTKVARDWQQLGGGYVNFRPPPPGSSPGAMGWYLGKYLAKRQDQRMARGYRRWTRAQSYAPDVRMRWVDPDAIAQVDDVAPAECKIVGWWHPLLPVVCRSRVWVTVNSQP